MKIKNIPNKKLKFKYPKLTLLVVIIILSYIIFKQPSVHDALLRLNQGHYFGILSAGLLYSFGFTSPFAAGFFLTIKPQFLLIAAIIGGIGALIADLIIFNFIKFSFTDEFDSLKKSKKFSILSKFSKKHIPLFVRRSFTIIIACIFIGSPLPDEIGIIILAGFTTMKKELFIPISFILNTLGIYILLLA